ncbi:MAG: hypothetical protein RJQ21_03975 [Rhodospirillales bacterium]
MFSDVEIRTIVVRSATDIGHEQFRGVWSLWQERRGGKPLPARSDFGIEEFLPWARHIGMFRVEGAVERLVVKLSSSTMIDLNRRDVTGCYLDEIVPKGTAEFIMEPYRLAAMERQAVFHSLVVEEDGRQSGLSALMLPMAENGCDTDYFAIALYLNDRIRNPFELTPLRRRLLLQDSAMDTD